MNKTIRRMLSDVGLEVTPDLIQLLKGENQILRIPNKIQHNMEKYFPKKALKDIHEDIEVAKELVFLTLSNLSSSWFESQVFTDKRAQQGYKRLDSQILKAQVKYARDISSPYKKILDYLLNNGVIEQGIKGSTDTGKATEYRLTKKYFSKGIDKYYLKTKIVRRMQVKKFNENFERVISTNIGKNSLRVRSKMFFPSDEEVEERLKEAIKNNYTNKKGKRLVRLGKHSTKEYPEEHFVYLEDYMERYRYLRDHMTVPIVSEDLTDARIFDCFNMMPSLIRGMLKINGMPIVETDFSALHPNISQMFYGGENEEGITHGKVVEELYGIQEGHSDYKKRRKAVKRMHLTFFNLPSEDLVCSPLYKYYDKKEPLMIERILEEKRQEEMKQEEENRIRKKERIAKGLKKKKFKNKGHAVTSLNLFMVETNMMEEIVGKLNDRGVDVLYVFDAIYSTEQDQPDVVQVMNEVAKKYRVKTNAVPAK